MHAWLSRLHGYLYHRIPSATDITKETETVWGIVAKSYEPSERALDEAIDRYTGSYKRVMTDHERMRAAIKAALAVDGEVRT